MAGVTVTNNTSVVNQGAQLQGTNGFELNRETGTMTYTVRAGDTLGKIRARAVGFARANGLSLAGGQSVGQIARQSGIDNADRIQVGQTITINTGSVQSETAPAPVCDSAPAAADPADTAVVTTQNTGPIYDDPSASYNPIVEATERYTGPLDEAKRAFAERIFNTLQAKGVISPDAKFSTWWGMGGVGNDITALISDGDHDGFLEVNSDNLFQTLQGEGLLRQDKANFTNALATIANRFFEDAVSGQQAVAGTSSPGDPSTMSAQEFDTYVQNTYRGKLCGNPELQAAFIADLEAFMAHHFVGSHINVNDRYVWTPQNDGQLSRDASGKARADCGVYANSYSYYFHAAGLQTEYFGTNLYTPGGVSGGHLQAVGYLPGGGFMLMNNNDQAVLSNQNFSSRNAKSLVRGVLTSDPDNGGFGRQTQIYGIYQGRTSQAVTVMQQQASVRNTSLGSLQDAVNSYSRYEGGLHFITDASLDQLVAKAGQARITNAALGNVMAWGATNEDVALNLLERVYLPQLNKMERALNTLQDLLADPTDQNQPHLSARDFPITINVDDGESSSSLTFNNKEELETYVLDQLIFVDQARESINDHLAALK